MSGDRCKTFDFATLSDLFNTLHGYYELNNASLAETIQEWNFLEDSNRQGAQIVARYMKWSFTVSFLELLNAWQWFLGGILLGRQVYMPAQVMQMYYYSIFFSCGAFLAAQFKGHYTLEVELLNEEDIQKMEIKQKRKEVWVGEDGNGEPCIHIKDKGRGGEHEIRANWFYEVFKDWDLKGDHPAVTMFESDRNYHVGFRNMFTYSLADIGGEFFYDPKGCPARPSDEILFSLWKREDWVDFFPEEFWALEHLKVPLNSILFK